MKIFKKIISFIIVICTVIPFFSVVVYILFIKPLIRADLHGFGEYAIGVIIIAAFIVITYLILLSIMKVIDWAMNNLNE